MTKEAKIKVENYRDNNYMRKDKDAPLPPPYVRGPFPYDPF